LDTQVRLFSGTERTKEGEKNNWGNYAVLKGEEKW